MVSAEAATMIGSESKDFGSEKKDMAAIAVDEADRASWLLCRAGNYQFAMPLDQVIECMRALPIEPVSGAPPFVRGLCIIRGAPVPVVDTSLILGDRPIEFERLVTVRMDGRTIALAVEAIVGIRHIALETITELPPLLQGAARVAVAAIAALDTELLFFLRTTRMIPEDWLDRIDHNGATS